MARQTEAKDAKGKAPEAGGGDAKPAAPAEGGPSLINLIIMAIVIIIGSSAASAASIYFLAPMVIKPMLAEMKPAEGEEGGEGGAEGEGHEAEGEGAHALVGPVIDLEEFTVNLKDAEGERYLRADLSVSVTAEDPKFEELAGEELHKWEEGFHAEMGHYVPAIRDICIAALTSRTSTELSTEQGKEQLKEEIKRNTDAVFHGKRKVIRVNLENFIIQ